MGARTLGPRKVSDLPPSSTPSLFVFLYRRDVGEAEWLDVVLTPIYEKSQIYWPLKDTPFG